MAHSAAQAAQLADAADAAARLYAVGFMKRHDPAVAWARDRLAVLRDAPETGPPLAMRAWCWAGDIGADPHGYVMTDEPRPEGLALWPEAPEWLPERHVRAYAWFLNVYIHTINLVRFLWPGDATVDLADLRPGLGHSVRLTVGGLPVTLDLGESTAAGWDEGVEVRFANARLTLRLPPPLLRGAVGSVTVERGAPLHDRVAPEFGWGWAFQRQAAAFVDDIATGAVPAASGRDGVEDLRLAEAIWRAGLPAG